LFVKIDENVDNAEVTSASSSHKPDVTEDNVSTSEVVTPAKV